MLSKEREINCSHEIMLKTKLTPTHKFYRTVQRPFLYSSPSRNPHHRYMFIDSKYTSTYFLNFTSSLTSIFAWKILTFTACSAIMISLDKSISFVPSLIISYLKTPALILSRIIYPTNWNYPFRKSPKL